MDTIKSRFIAAWTITKNGSRKVRRIFVNGHTDFTNKFKSMFEGYTKDDFLWAGGTFVGAVLGVCVVAVITFVNVVLSMALLNVSVYLAYLWLIVSVISILTWSVAFVNSTIENVKDGWTTISLKRKMVIDPEGFVQDVRDIIDHLGGTITPEPSGEFVL